MTFIIPPKKKKQPLRKLRSYGIAECLNCGKPGSVDNTNCHHCGEDYYLSGRVGRLMTNDYSEGFIILNSL